MGEEAQAALSAIETTRATLERDLDELFARMPDPGMVARRAKTYGAAAAGVAIAAGVAAVSARSKAQASADRMRARVNAEELARAFSTTPVPAEESGSKAGLIAAVIAVLAVLAALAGRANK